MFLNWHLSMDWLYFMLKNIIYVTLIAYKIQFYLAGSIYFHFIKDFAQELKIFVQFWQGKII